MLKETYDAIPKLNKKDLSAATTLYFYTTFILLLYIVFINNDAKSILDYYYPLSILIVIGGLSMATEEWSDLSKLITITTLVRYIVPGLLVLLVKSNTNINVHALKYLFYGIVLYNVYLLLFYNRNMWEQYGTKELNIAFLSSGIVGTMLSLIH